MPAFLQPKNKNKLIPISDGFSKKKKCNNKILFVFASCFSNIQLVSSYFDAVHTSIQKIIFACNFIALHIAFHQTVADAIDRNLISNIMSAKNPTQCDWMFVRICVYYIVHYNIRLFK